MKKYKQVIRLLNETGLDPSFLKKIPIGLAGEIIKRYKRVVLSTLHSDRVVGDKAKKIYIELSDRFDQLERIGFDFVHTSCIFGGKKDKEEYEEIEPSININEELISKFVLGNYFYELIKTTERKFLAVTHPNILFKNKNYITIDDLFNDDRFSIKINHHNKSIAKDKIKEINELIKLDQEKIDGHKNRIKIYKERIHYLNNLESRIKKSSLEDKKSRFIQEYLDIRKKIFEQDSKLGRLLEVYEWFCAYRDNPYRYITKLISEKAINFSEGIEARVKNESYKSGVNLRLLNSLPKNLSEELSDARMFLRGIYNDIDFLQWKEGKLSELSKKYKDIGLQYKSLKEEMKEKSKLSDSEARKQFLSDLVRIKGIYETKLKNAKNEQEIKKWESKSNNIKNSLDRVIKLSDNIIKKRIIERLDKKKESYEFRIKKIETKIEEIKETKISSEKEKFSKIINNYNSKIKRANQDINKIGMRIGRYECSINDLNDYKDRSLFITINSSYKKIYEKYLGFLDDSGKIYAGLRKYGEEGSDPLTILKFEPDMTISFYNIKDIFYQFSNKEKFSRTTRKLIGFINIESINKYISEIQAVRKYLIKGRESPEMEDRVIPSEIILESGAWKTISTSPNKYQYALSVEDLNEQKIYRLEGKVVTDLYTDIKNPIPLQD